MRIGGEPLIVEATQPAVSHKELIIEIYKLRDLVLESVLSHETKLKCMKDLHDLSLKVILEMRP